MHKLTLVALAAGIVGLTATSALAAPSAQSKQFATKAAQSGLAEVQEGQLAQQNGGSAQVKQFGQTLVQDHTAANQNLQQIAQHQGITLPDKPSSSQQSELKRLRGMSGQQFDRSFAQHEVQDHKQAIALFQQEAKNGKDPELQTFAQQTLPVLRKHLEMAQQLSSSNH